MRDRYRERQGIGVRKDRWKDRKARVDLDDSVPLGSATWINKAGPWFEEKNQGFDYQKWRSRLLNALVRTQPRRGF